MTKIAGGICAVLLLLAATQLFAQNPRNYGGRYAPSRPAISPWLYLQRGNTGGIPSYYAWVQPEFQYQQRTQYVDRQLGNIEGQLTRRPEQGAGVPSTAATYMNYGHFYPMQSAPAGQR
ncbi:MAG TPA: hypothetical protein VL096_12625 [Pirellulaceae bacterium]|nr:hypothetical protein [Pirellulaceae bacterium]